MGNLIQTLFFFFLITEICFTQWVQTSLDSCVINCVLVKDSALFAGTACSDGGVYRSSDNGTSWIVVNSGLPTNDFVNCLEVSGNNLFAGLEWGGIFRSTNNGASWTEVNVGLSNLNVHALAVNGSKLYAGAGEFGNDSTGGVFLSINEGISWTPINSGLQPNWKVVSLAVSENKVFAGVYGRFGGHMYISTNAGTNWSPLELQGLKIATSGANVLVATYWAELMGNGGNICLSTDGGTSWISTIFDYAYCDPPCVTISKTNLFVGANCSNSYKYGVVFSADSGTSWTAVNEGLTDSNNVNSLFVCGAYLFAGTANGIWRRPLSEIITDVEDAEKLPAKFLLSNNFPNPFNPSTSIQYAISSRQFVTLKIFDILGNEIETLVNEEKSAGTYEVTWNSEHLPSGVYFYQLRAGSFVETKKMLLLK